MKAHIKRRRTAGFWNTANQGRHHIKAIQIGCAGSSRGWASDRKGLRTSTGTTEEHYALTHRGCGPRICIKARRNIYSCYGYSTGNGGLYAVHVVRRR